MTAIGKIKGMTAEIEAKLQAAQITKPEQLLQAGATPAGRKDLIAKSGVDGKLLLEFLNQVDLARVKGIGEVFSNLLEAAGVDTVKELAHRVPENLHTKLVEINAAQKLANRAPKVEEIEAWVAEAKALPKILEY
jgi:predicted flap endonuclease-1-like 5' DNA nuclease